MTTHKTPKGEDCDGEIIAYDNGLGCKICHAWLPIDNPEKYKRLKRDLEKPGPHIHGCGHPVRPVIICDDPVCTCIGMMHYMDWSEIHDKLESEGLPCICYFCFYEKMEGIEKIAQGISVGEAVEKLLQMLEEEKCDDTTRKTT